MVKYQSVTEFYFVTSCGPRQNAIGPITPVMHYVTLSMICYSMGTHDMRNWAASIIKWYYWRDIGFLNKRLKYETFNSLRPSEAYMRQ